MAYAQNLWLPLYTRVTSISGGATFSLNSPSNILGFVFEAQEPATITQLGFRYGTRTGVPPTYRISLQGVDSVGLPDTVVKGGANPASATFTPPANSSWNNLWQWITLDNSYTVSRGEPLSIVIDHWSGTCDASNFSSIYSLLNTSNRRHPYATTNGTPLAGIPIFGYRSATRVYGLPNEGVSSTFFSSMTAASSPDEIAIEFAIPTYVCSTYKIKGFSLLCTPSAGNNCRVQLYSGYTVLQSVLIDGDKMPAGAWSQFMFDEDPLSELSSGTVYRLGFAPQGGTWTFRGYTVASASDMDAYPLGQNVYMSHRTDDGVWNEAPSNRQSRMLCDLLIDDLTPPSGGSGLIVHPGMVGGMRG